MASIYINLEAFTHNYRKWRIQRVGKVENGM